MVKQTNVVYIKFTKHTVFNHTRNHEMFNKLFNAFNKINLCTNKQFFLFSELKQITCIVINNIHL